MSESWYTKGCSEEDLKKAEKEQSSGGAQRLWMPPGETKRVVMLDDEPFCVWEHNPKINGQYKDNWFTCRKGMDGGCPMCESRMGRYYVGFITVLDVKGWVSTKGKNKGEVIGKNRRMLLPLKTKSLKRFNILKKNKVSLVGAMFDLTRSGEDAPACGDMFDFVEMVDLDKAQEYWYKSKLENDKLKQPEPFNYLELMKPLSRPELARIGSGASSSGGSGSGSKGDEEFTGEESGGGDSDTLY